jgi:hypothetical protein
VPVVGGEVLPSLAAQLGTRACLCRTIVAETQQGWFELSVTAPEVDVHAVNDSGQPVLVTRLDAATCERLALEELHIFTKEWPTKLREASKEAVVPPSAPLTASTDTGALAAGSKTHVEKTFFQALSWGQRAQEQVGIFYDGTR